MKHASVALLFLALSGCSLVGPDYKRPDLGLPASFAEPAAGGDLAVPAQWWSLYGDPKLDELVRAGLERNADVKAATARVQEAEAALREAHAILFFPQIDGDAGASRGRGYQSGAYGTGSNFNLGISTSFEVDVWGRLRRAEMSVRDNLLASRYGKDTVALTLAAAIARAYFAALSLDTQYVASEQILKAADDSLVLAKKRADAGVASMLDYYQAGTLRTGAAAQAKEVARQRAVIVHQLAVLTGRFELEVPNKDVLQLPLPPLPPPGLPSQLLERRPDVRQSEALLSAATQRIGVAKGAQFPALTLTGSLGLQSGDLDTLFKPGAKVWSLGAGLLGPVLDGGRYRARTQQAEAQALQAEADYQRTVETAFREVSDALSNVRLAADTERDLREHLDQSRNAFRLATQRYERGYSAYLEVLDAQRTLNDAQLLFIRNRQAYLSYTVDLMNALGGGWVPAGS
jgi:outer membrane protein, multidrug efflux system